MENLDDNVLKLILERFHEKAESFFVRLVCKRWSTIVKKTTVNVNRVAQYYAEQNSRTGLEWLQGRYPQ
jgi:hypothetical protein